MGYSYCGFGHVLLAAAFCPFAFSALCWLYDWEDREYQSFSINISPGFSKTKEVGHCVNTVFASSQGAVRAVKLEGKRQRL
jgi:hypothetical protein